MGTAKKILYSKENNRYFVSGAGGEGGGRPLA